MDRSRRTFRGVFEGDLRRDKTERNGLRRTDAKRFLIHERGEGGTRISVSYLLKLALADAIGSLSSAEARVPGSP